MKQHPHPHPQPLQPIDDLFNINSAADRNDAIPLLAAANLASPAVHTAAPARWWVLACYAYLSALQSLLWMTWSSVPTAAREFLNVGDGTLQMFLNEGPIAFVAVVFAAGWLLQRRNGLRHSVLLAAVLCAAASVIRTIPAWMTAHQREEQYHSLSLACVHIGQTLNAAVAPLVVASPSFLSLTWFPERERNTATAIANVASALGRAIGFFLGPGLVPHDDPAHIPSLLYVETGLSILPLIGVLVYYPDHPAAPPSKAAAAARTALLESQKQSQSLCASIGSSVRDVVRASSQPRFLLLALAGGLQMGVYGAWSGVLTLVMSKHFGTARSGALGSANTFAGIFGGILAGRLTDHPKLNRRLKSVLLVLSTLSGGLFLLFALPLSPYRVQGHHTWPYAALLTICTAAGLFRGAMDPLFFELSAELTHPLPAGVSGSVLTLFYHLLLVASLSIPSDILNRWTSTIMYGSTVLCVMLLIPLRVNYVRRIDT